MLSVLRRGGMGNYGCAMWVVKCDCGSAEKEVAGKHLRDGSAIACGCQRGRKTSMGGRRRKVA